MRLSRYLAIGAVLSLVLHGTGSAFFAADPDEVSVAASEGGQVSVIGSIEDLVAGAKANVVSETEPVADVEPAGEPARPVREPVEVAEVTPETPVQPVEVTPVQLVSEPVSARSVSAAGAGPVVDGVTRADPVTAVEPLKTDLAEKIPAAETASPVEPATPARPVDRQTAQQPVEIARAEPAATTEPARPVTQELQVQQPVEDPLPEVTQTPRAKPKPPVRKAEPKKTPEKKVRTAQTKGAETSSRKGGEQVTASTARSNANGRKDARTRDGGTRATSNYKGKVVARLRRAKRYPSQARRRSLEGTAHVAFTISRSGAVSGIRLTRSSGHGLLDQAALDMVRRASPMPKFPAGITAPAMSLQVPVRFDR